MSPILKKERKYIMNKFDKMKLEIYEAYENSMISEKEKFMLLSEVSYKENLIFINESVIDLINEGEYTDALYNAYTAYLEDNISENVLSQIFNLILENANTPQTIDSFNIDKNELINRKYKLPRIKNNRYREVGLIMPNWVFEKFAPTIKVSLDSIDIKILEFVADKTNGGELKETQYYEKFFKEFCTRYNLKKSSKLYLEYEPTNKLHIE